MSQYSETPDDFLYSNAKIQMEEVSAVIKSLVGEEGNLPPTVMEDIVEPIYNALRDMEAPIKLADMKTELEHIEENEQEFDAFVEGYFFDIEIAVDDAVKAA
jgi:hypothetical protein